ncbi:MAG: aminoacyl-histidine dipeptidase [Marinifilaceae bacterium]
MSNEIANLTPKAVWENFYKLTQVPRPSNHEETARAFMMKWAKENGIEAEEDAVGNIILRKPATPGMENRQGVILQGHLDMVPQKNEGTEHNFKTDPISTYIDGEWVRAKGTTLGADNGIGVAAAMGVLTATDIEHGPVEVLITATEETGMDGANGLQPGVLKGDILLNMDSEDEGELYVGCAGGIDGTISFKYTKESIPTDYVAYKIVVKGLKGGHSGMDINTGRGNSNKLLFRFLKSYACDLDIRISNVKGGSLRNAIPRESFATVVLPAANVEKLTAAIKETEAIFKNELSAKEPTLELFAEACGMPEFIIASELQGRFVNSILACPNGPVRMIDSMPDTVETSNNLAIIKFDGDKIIVSTLLRSSVDTAKEALAQTIQAVFELAKADTIEFTGAYPGWKPNPDSAILATMEKVYNALYGKTPKTMAVHAGLECGVLGAKYTNWDMISFGPTIRNPHSPDERVNVPSVEKFWEFLKATLKAVPVK